ncbi:MAG TPA: amidase [Candidatus Acidoferrales bacterium]|nr:amidase [Candidatus Acidoferrales bacterium]
MTETELAFATIEEVAPLIRKKKISPVELTELMLRRIERLNPRLNAYITVTAELAMKQARKAEAEISAPRSRACYRGPLHGIPISLKDNIHIAGVRTTAGSKILAEFTPDGDAAVVALLKRAGAVLLGKMNMHEFAYGVTSNNPHYGAVHNPWDLERIPGGSSGGSAAALAAGLCYASLGTDTGGSIRIPAALCGIVGLKPNFGRVNTEGVVPLSRSLDHVGPMARSVVDVALVLRALVGDNDQAGALQKVPLPFTIKDPSEVNRGPRRPCRLAIPKNYFYDDLDEEVRAIVQEAARSFERLGAVIQEVSMPNLDRADTASTNIALAEARAYHQAQGWYPARAADYGEDVRKRLEWGGEVRAVDYLLPAETHLNLGLEFLGTEETGGRLVDALLVPTVPFAAPRIGEEKVMVGGKEASVRGELIRLNRPANFFRMPAISIPCGFTRSGLPVGLQIIGRQWDDANVLRLAQRYQQRHDWHLRWPPLE